MQPRYRDIVPILYKCISRFPSTIHIDGVFVPNVYFWQLWIDDYNCMGLFLGSLFFHWSICLVFVPVTFLLHDSTVYFEIRFCDTSRNQLFVQEFLFFGRSKSLRILCFFFLWCISLQFWWWLQWNYRSFASINIFTIVILLIHKHGRSFHLLTSLTFLFSIV
jgi:hypothetical protein